MNLIFSIVPNKVTISLMCYRFLKFFIKKMVSNISQIITNFKIPYEWIYRGEGNCNVVLSLPKSRKILRIRKIDRPKTLIEWLIVWISDFLYWYCGKSVKEELRDLKFYSFIMRPLIGRRYTSEANQVILNRTQTKMLENELSKYRPGKYFTFCI